MLSRPQDGDTIVAVATPPGHGGISVIRISGDAAISYASSFCQFFQADKLQSHRCYYGVFKDANGEDLDQVVLTYFKKGRSYTGDCTIEISCHGNPLICKKIISCFSHAGARLAEPGEFTYRAFMNGNIDLVQAESVLQLIESDGDRALRKSLSLLSGELSKKFVKIRDDITWVMANLEAGIDFIEENLDITELPGLIERVQQIERQLKVLLASKAQSKVIFEGFRVGLFGVPNSGKSSLINKITGSDVSIVTSQAGTTRDLIRAKTRLDGYSIEFIDTAGLRDTDEEVEAIGVQRSKDLLSDVDLRVVLFANDIDLEMQKKQMANLSVDIIIISKSDKIGDSESAEIKGQLKDFGGTIVECSSVTEDGLLALESEILQKIEASESSLDGEVMILNRHHEILQKSYTSLLAGIKLLKNNTSPEFVVQEFRVALLGMKDILGERFDDDVMDRVFKEFCIGK